MKKTRMCANRFKNLNSTKKYLCVLIFKCTEVYQKLKVVFFLLLRQVLIYFFAIIKIIVYVAKGCLRLYW